MDYNNELIGIIDRVHSNVDTQATMAHNCRCPTLSSSSSVAAETAAASVAAETETETMATVTATAATPVLMTTDIPNLIDFDDCQQQYKHSKSTETSSFDEISIQNVRTFFAAFVVSPPKFRSFCLPSRNWQFLLSFSIFKWHGDGERVEF